MRAFILSILLLIALPLYAGDATSQQSDQNLDTATDTSQQTDTSQFDAEIIDELELLELMDLLENLNALISLEKTP